MIRLPSTPSEAQHLSALVRQIEAIRLRRKRTTPHHPNGKRFSQDELCALAYPSYKNMILARTGRLPDREALLQIADYLECTPGERNDLLRAARYATENLPDLQRRKQATILIANVFMPSSPELDLEDAAQMMSAFRERLETIIVLYGGVVAEQTGTMLVALWSIETTREDDPAQAIRAGLALQGELQTVHAESRIGIHTGQVLLQSSGTSRGSGSSGQLQTAGEAVNLASHLSHRAPPNGLLISGATYSHVQHSFEVARVEETLAVPVYAVLAVKPSSGRILPHRLPDDASPLIGREAEFGALRAALDEVQADDQQRMVILSADAGVGKSRLLQEFDGALDTMPEVFSFKGRANQSSQKVPYALLRSMLSFRFQITDDEVSETAHHKIEKGFAEVMPDSEAAQKAAHVISHLLSFNQGDSLHVRNALSDAQEFFEIALAHLARYFMALAATHSVVLMLEDVHWADDSSLTLLGRLSAILADQRVLIVYTRRPDTTRQRLAPTLPPDRVQSIDLQPLSKAESGALVDSLLVNVRAVPDKLRTLVIDNSGGNPLYIEELVKMLMDSGTLFKRSEQQWIVNDDHLTSLQVPSTLTALLQARFEALSPAQQRILQIASVFGRTFWDQAIKALAQQHDARNDTRDGEQETPALTLLIGDLCGQKLIVRQRKSTFRGYAEYAFNHALSCAVIYETILKQDRLAYHAAAARWLVGTAARNGRLDEYAGLIAYHFRCAAVANEATAWYWRAGQAAATRFANSEALAYLTCALELTPTDKLAERYPLLAARERVYDALGAREEQAADLETLFATAQTLEDTYLQVEVIVRQTNYAYLMSSSAEVARLARAAIRLAGAIKATQYQASSYVMLGNVLWDEGDQVNANICYDQALRLASGDAPVH